MGIARAAVVLAGGDAVDPAVRDALPDGAYVVAADSGLHQAEPLGLRVDRIVGDLDSADPDVVERAARAGAFVEAHPAEKDATDLELALRHVVGEGIETVVVVGGAGGRLDHFLANALLLASPAFSGAQVDAHMGGARVAVVRGGGRTVDLAGAVGDLVTLLPVGGPARGIVTEGLRYPLAGDDLDAGTSRGVSNELLGPRGSVRLESGTLLAVQPAGDAR